MIPYKKFRNIAKATEEEWLNLRREGIGGSDAPAIMGFSKWSSPTSIYLSKVEPPAVVNSDENERLYFGHVMEDVVAQEFAKRNPGFKPMKSSFMYQSKEHPFMLANIDRLIKGKNIGLECKNVDGRKADEWEGEEGIPLMYQIQCYHYMKVMGFEGMFIAAIVGGNHYVQHYLPRNDIAEENMALIVEAEKRFWEDHVVPRVPPDPSTLPDLKALYPQDTGNLVEATAEDLLIASQLFSISEQMKSLDAQKEELIAKLAVKLKDNSGIMGVCSFKSRAGSISYKKLAEDLLGKDKIAEVKDKYIGPSTRTFKNLWKPE